jgi:hypothetical protein
VGGSKELIVSLIVGGLALGGLIEEMWGGLEIKGLGVEEDLLGVEGLYQDMGAGLLLGGFGLFICLFVVLCLVGGMGRGALRAI